MNDIVIHTVRTDTVAEKDLARLAERMPLRAQRAARFRRPADRLLCLGAGLLLLDGLKIADEQMIRCGPYGKPSVPGCPPFSISHSGARCILACLARGEAKDIGADIEETDVRHLDAAPAVFTEAELNWMRDDPVSRFFRLWTWKESVMKATGLGMNLDPRGFEVLPFAEGGPVRVLGRTWYAAGDKLDGNWFSVCADAPIGKLSLAEMN